MVASHLCAPSAWTPCPALHSLDRPARPCLGRRRARHQGDQESNKTTTVGRETTHRGCESRHSAGGSVTTQVAFGP